MSNIPNELKYTKEHEWIKIDGDVVTKGITDHAQEALTDIVFVELPDIGKEVEKDKNMCNVESVKSVSDIFAPLSGEIVEKNEKLMDNPEVINQDCYGEGWIVKIKLKNTEELDGLMSAEDYKNLIE